MRWECDTPLAREMAQFKEAPDFLNFCLERADEFSKRDWLAALTLLTTRKCLNLSSPVFQKFTRLVLDQADEQLADSVHLLLHRFGVLGHTPAVWRLLPLLRARLPLLSPKQVAVSAWALGRALVNDEEAWAELGVAIRGSANDFALPDLAMVAWALAVVERVEPSEVVAVKKAVRSQLMGQDLAGVISHDLCMLFKAVAKLTPDDRRFHDWLFLLMLEGMANKTMPFAAQGLTSIWSTLAALRWTPEAEALEVLCEESRMLRLDHTFNQDMAADLARALLTLDISDGRPAYQVVDFVGRKGLSLRADTLLVLVEFFALRNVMHEVAWKRLGVRAQQRAVDLKLPDLDRLVNAFRRSGRGNNRIYGMLELFVKLREDQATFGSA